MFAAIAAKLQTTAVAAVLILLIAVTLAWFFLPLKDWAQSFTTWIRQLGWSGVIIFVIAYILLVIVLAPAEVMSIAAGFVFGAWGFPLVIIAATIGAVLAFLLSRYFVRQRVQALAGKRPLFKVVDKAIKEEGWKIVALLRLNPLVPFNLQNYFFGATDIGILPYALATFFGIMPGSIAYVYLGTLGQMAADGNGSSAPKIALLAAGLVATVVLIFIIARRATAKLKSFGIEKSRA